MFVCSLVPRLLAAVKYLEYCIRTFDGLIIGERLSNVLVQYSKDLNADCEVYGMMYT